jgi:predicted NBD/HSP70 family sugar kinase
MASLEHQPFEDSTWRGRLPAKSAYALGIYIRKDLLSGVVIDVDGNVAKQGAGRGGPARLTHQLRATDVASVIDGVAALAGQLSALHPDFAQLGGLGVTLSGQVNEDNATVQWSHRMGWDGSVPLAQLLEQATGYPTMVEHDVKALALAEQMFGLGQGRRSFAVVTAGLGVGAALVIDHQLWRGLSGTAGELGHLVVEPGGKSCLCGKRGCLETVAGSAGILGLMEAGGRPGIHDIEATAQLARKGDELARRAFEHAGEALGRGLSWLVNLFNLELVVVRAEEPMRASGVYEAAARRTFQEHAFYQAAEECELVILSHDHWLGARSAASMVFRLLADRLPELGDAES